MGRRGPLAGGPESTTSVRPPDRGRRLWPRRVRISERCGWLVRKGRGPGVAGSDPVEPRPASEPASQAPAIDPWPLTLVWLLPALA